MELQLMKLIKVLDSLKIEIPNSDNKHFSDTTLLNSQVPQLNNFSPLVDVDWVTIILRCRCCWMQIAEVSEM
jgi:hypothetical protein